jgi:hypothetical protein
MGGYFWECFNTESEKLESRVKVQVMISKSKNRNGLMGIKQEFIQRVVEKGKT